MSLNHLVHYNILNYYRNSKVRGKKEKIPNTIFGSCQIHTELSFDQYVFLNF